MNRWLIRNAAPINEGRKYEADLRVVDDRIEGIDPMLDALPDKQVIDARGPWLLPGMIDDQVHFHEPGFPRRAGGRTPDRSAQVKRLAMAVGFWMSASACLSVSTSASFGSERVLLELPSVVDQGSLVLGVTDETTRIRLGERWLRVDGEGRFVFGVGRDEAGPIQLHVSDVEGGLRLVEVKVRSRAWPTERVNGVAQETVTPTPAMAARIAREQAAVALARQRDDARSDFAVIYQWPLKGRISGVFGSQRIYNGEPRSPHSGLDVAAATGTLLRAPAGGVVIFAEPALYLTGGTILLDHGHGVSSVFLHLSRIKVQMGQRVAAGQVLGDVGATGRASGPHMHWGLNWFDVRLDPSLLPGIKVP